MTAARELQALEAVALAHVRDVAEQLVLPMLGDGGEHRWATETQVHTEADEIVGAELERRFAESFPGHGLVIEDRPEVAGDGVHTWYVDPVDGSANHLRGIPYVAVTAGLIREGRPVVGVVHDVVRGVTFSATAGTGARRHGRHGARGPEAAPRVATTATLADAILIAHLSRRGPLLNVPDALRHLLFQVRKIRCMGSIALDFALLAAGEADLLVVGRGRPQRMLDIVGGIVVLEESGGAVMTATGAPVTEETRTLIAGSPELCAAFVELMAGFDLEGWTADRASRG